MSYSIYLPSYSIGIDAYEKIDSICKAYGSRAIAIGGHKAIKASKAKICKAVELSEISILDFLWYGGEASYENVEKLQLDSFVQQADMIFAIGGGKALDTAKALGDILHKPVFTFPTISSNCSACTSVSIMYHQDGSFKNPYFFQQPPTHAFIDLEIISKAPDQYMWAGLGDSYAKYFESSISSRGEEIPQYITAGIMNAKMCYETILKYGAQGLKDNKQGIVSAAFEQAVLSVIVTTGIASILLTSDHIIDYNTGLAHGIFYALTSFPKIEENHLHGELVGLGILVLLLVDENLEDFNKVYDFNQQVDLPISVENIELSKEELQQVIHNAVLMKDIEHNPYQITEEMLENAFNALKAFNDR